MCKKSLIYKEYLCDNSIKKLKETGRTLGALPVFLLEKRLYKFEYVFYQIVRFSFKCNCKYFIFASL